MSTRAKLFGLRFEDDPYPVYARLREEQPVCQVSLRDGLRCWLVTRYADARAALADPRLSRDPRMAGAEWRESDRGRPLEDGSSLGIHLLTREPPDHTRLRRLVSKAFGPREAERLRGRVQEIADSLVDAFQGEGEAELIADFAYPLAITVVGEILGIPEDDHRYFRQWTSNRVDQPPVSAPGPDAYLRALVEAKRRSGGDDLTTALATAHGNGELSEGELLSMLFLLLIAGHEGSVGLIGNGIVALLTHPDQIARWRTKPQLIDSAVEEVLRYDGSMELAAWRFATEPVRIGGTTIPTGAPVLIALAGAHRDPDRFTEPDRFDIARADNPHLGFGHGVHYCLGAPIARIEGGVALATLFRRLPDLALAVPPDDLRRQPSFVIRGLHELPVTFTPQA